MGNLGGSSGLGYVGNLGQVLTRDTLAAKAAQYPDNVGVYEEYIRSHYLGRRTADCVGFIKGTAGTTRKRIR